jgi:hypothetical protein
MPTINTRNLPSINFPDTTGTVLISETSSIAFDFNDFPQARSYITVGFESSIKAVPINENGQGVIDDNTTIQLNHPLNSDYWLEPR